MKRGELTAAVSSFSEALKIQPGAAGTHSQLALALAKQRDFVEAAAHYREALRLAPDSASALNNLAWLLATCPEPGMRDGTAAAQLAGRACELSTNQQPIFVGTLAAAYAEAGQFNQAVETARRARDLAASLGQTNLAQRNQELMELFKTQKPYRETN
jgi:Flp pilus assembly protein TadD